MSALDPFALGGWQDPILTLIAEAARLWAEVIPIREAVEEEIRAEGRSWYAAEKAGDPAFDEVNRLEDAASKIGTQISQTKPITIAGCVALLEWCEGDHVPGLRETIIESLREIAGLEQLGG